ncbi:MAG TPA: HlyD family efflux transporter periplasmic adaptor subunit [Candidatus Binataceae bacterium]
MAWQGGAVLALGLPTGFTTFSSVVLGLAMAALITFGGYSRRVDMEGAVLPSTGVIAISAPSPGRIEMLTVQEGEAVEKGAALYTVDLDTATKDGGAQQRIIDAQIGGREMLKREIERKVRMSEETERELREKIEALTSEKNQLREQITIEKGLVAKLANDYAQFSRLAERHIVALSELNTRQQAWMQALARLQDLETNNIRLQGELKEAEYQLATTAHTRTDENDALKTKILEIDEKLANSEAHRLIEIRAPEDGVVTAIVAHAGQTVGAGSPMLKIVPRHAPMQAELLAPSSAVGFIKKGAHVLLRYGAFPYQKFGEYWGTVATVSQAAMSADEVKGVLGVEPAKQTGPFYRVIVIPDSQFARVYGEERPLPASMRVQAYALLDRRQLYEWILEPLYEIGRAAHGL